uniref:Mitochondrial import inner membrane translocase subunit TIM50 n=1 Tax=Babesia bovis TaxID=5865 RepID=S6BI75_BABBO|nr:conserved hypothetical protein [Babesia bovis]
MATFRGIYTFRPSLKLLNSNYIPAKIGHTGLYSLNIAGYSTSSRDSYNARLYGRTCARSNSRTPETYIYGLMESCARYSTSNATAESSTTEQKTEGNGTASQPGTKTESNSGDTNDSDTQTKADRKSPLPMGIFGCASMVLAGYCFAGFREKDETIMATLERGMDRIIEKLNGMFVNDDGPLLPDIKDLNYPPNLPTLVVDLDKVVAKLEYDRRTGWQLKKRPYADRFFRELINYYEIVVWSDDSYPVATDVANRWGLPVIGCIHRDRCTKFKGSYIKDLSKLGRDLNRVILLDHDRVACMLQEDNAILVREFDGDESDNELLHLIGLLKTIAINPTDVKRQIMQFGGGLDRDIGRRFAEKHQYDAERARARQSLLSDWIKHI